MNQEFESHGLTLLILIVIYYYWIRNALSQSPPQDGQTGESRADTALALSNHADTVACPTGASDDDAQWEGIAQPGSTLARGLSAIRRIDRSFEVQGFLSGARAAYEVIVQAFTDGDRPALEGLLAPDVYEAFVTVIAEREADGQRIESSFVSVAVPQIIEADVYADTAQVTLRFASEMVTATRDSGGLVIDGDPRRIIEVIDLWTFARTASPNANWKLIATEVD